MGKINKIRYDLTPQMRHYDKIGQTWLAHLMYFHTRGYSSAVVNTDSRGFRIAHKGGITTGNFNNPHNEPVCLIVGGSFAFGVGATHDKKTIASILNENSDSLCFNFAGRSFSSTQELLLFLFYHQKITNIKNVVLLSGLNSLVLHYLLGRKQDDIGPFFLQSEYTQKMNTVYNFPNNKNIKYFFNKLLNKKKSALIMKEDDSDREQLLSIFKRDIVNWKLFSRSLGFKLRYVLQPVAEWIKRERSEEEVSLFNVLDSHQGPRWLVLKNKINYDCYVWFLSQIQRICREEDVPFFDMNKALSDMRLDKEWLFVDRVHCTDKGYAIVSKILKEKVLL